MRFEWMPASLAAQGVILIGTLMAPALMPSRAATQPVIAEFPLPAGGSPFGITAGPDGNLWFTEQNGNRIGRITPAGVITEFPVLTPGSFPRGITVGPDGNLWFAAASGSIGRVTPTGAITEFSVGGSPREITAGPDGNLWFTDQGGNSRIGRITPAGAITGVFPLAFGSQPDGITTGPDGNLWFTEQGGDRIGRITPAGVITEFSLPTVGSSPTGITVGPDGNLWFTEQNGNRIGRITPAGVITEFSLPTVGSSPTRITAGPDGNLWFTEQNGNRIGRITPAGVITEFPVPTAGSRPFGITAGPDGNLWFTEFTGDRIGRIPPGAGPPVPVIVILSAGPGGVPADGASQAPVISADGRFAVFASRAGNLVAGGAPAAVPQVYRVERQTGQVTRVSQTATGAPGDAASGDPVVSADGRYVVYPTLARNLVPGCNGVQQIVRTDMDTRTTVCVSQGPAGPGTTPSRQPTISGDGNLIAFVGADGLDPACANGVEQIHLRDVTAGITRCVSVDASGQAGTGPSFDPALSQDGTTLVFATQATNLLFGPGAAGATARSRGAGGRGLVEPLAQVVQKSTAVGANLTTLVSQGATGALGNGASREPALAADGTTVAFTSTATNLVPECGTGTAQVFVQAASGMTCASRDETGAPGDGPSSEPALSGDGLVVVWASLAQNLTRGVTGPGGLPQILRTNLGLQNAVVELLSQTGGAAGNGGSTKPSVDFAGQVTVFQTGATNLGSGDTNGQDDVLLVVVAFAPPGMPDRVRITSPGSGAAFPLATPTLLTLTWTARAGAARYALEFTGADRVFANPNGTGPDSINGFGGAGGVVLVTDPRLEVTLGPGFPAGLYQVRVIALTADLQVLGRFSDAVTLALGAVPPGNGRVTITQPLGGTVLMPGQRVTFLWGALPGVASYLFEFTGAGGQFGNPNGTGPDPGNTTGNGLIVSSTGFETTVPALAPGVYQVRVIGLTAAGAFVGTFSDAVSLTIP
jgi:streptogramin lyase/Tol biopolymer transport system component